MLSDKSKVTLRQDRSSPLTQQEVDENFQQVKNAIDDVNEVEQNLTALEAKGNQIDNLGSKAFEDEEPEATVSDITDGIETSVRRLSPSVLNTAINQFVSDQLGGVDASGGSLGASYDDSTYRYTVDLSDGAKIVYGSVFLSADDGGSQWGTYTGIFTDVPGQYVYSAQITQTYVQSTPKLRFSFNFSYDNATNSLTVRAKPIYDPDDTLGASTTLSFSIDISVVSGDTEITVGPIPDPSPV